jgi:glycosyltransferase involved in cell wall biosynthesis
MLTEGKFGLFFPARPDGIASLLQACEQNPEKMNGLREQAREGLGSKYNWDEVTNAYLAVLNELKQGR